MVKSVFMCGGLSGSGLWRQIHADVLNLPICIPDEEQSVLLGGAILARAAHSYNGDVQQAMSLMGGHGTLIQPNPKTIK